MGSQQLCLKWNNHHSNMQNMFEELLNSETFVDVTLACDGCTLKAHKLVLSACSPFFHNIFVENPCKHPVIILKDMRITELKAIVNFMYRGEVNISQDQLSALLKTAETLKIKGLAEITGDSRAQHIQQAASSDSTFSSTGSYEAHQTPSPPSLSRRKRTRPQKQLLNDAAQSDSDENFPTKISHVSNNIETEPLSLYTTTQKETSSSLINQHFSKSNSNSATILDNGAASSEPTRSLEVETVAEPQPPLAQTPSFESSEQPASPSLTDDLDNGINSSSPSSLVPYSEASSLPVILEVKPEVQYDGGSGSNVNSPEVTSLVYPDTALAGPSSFPDESIETPSASVDGGGGSNRFGPLHASYNLHATLDMVLKRKEYAGGYIPGGGGGGSIVGDKGDKPNCPICNKTYSSKSNLQRHMEMHFGQRKKYACHVCKKFFTWKTNLTTHIKTIHKSITSS